MVYIRYKNCNRDTLTPDSITFTGMYGAILVVAILLVVLSIPSIILTVRGSSKLLGRYKLLRSVNEANAENIPKVILNEWTAVKSPLTYVSMLSDEIERLNTLRPAVLQAEIASVLIILLAIIPQFEGDLLYVMIGILVVVFAALIYARMNTHAYAVEYVTTMAELENNGGESHDMIYG